MASDDHTSAQGKGDSVFTSKSDNPGSQITSTLFDGTDYQDWSHNVRMALGAKYKLGYIDGSTPRPTAEGEELARWTRTDFMVRCWISNSMVKSISSCFRFVTSAQELWKELAERYAPSNAPLLFQLRRNLANLKQDSLSVTDYYGKLVLLWDDLRGLEPTIACSCAARTTCVCELAQKLLASENRHKLIDFLMGLSDCYDGIRGQILGMDPLPTLNKAFFLVQQLESQRSVSQPSGTSLTEASALAVGKHQPKMSKEDYKKMKLQRFCDFCKQRGHLKDSCFKLTGFPDWFKGNKGGSEQQSSRPRANVAHQDHPLDHAESSNAGASSDHIDPVLISTICQEIVKAFKGHGQDPLPTPVLQPTPHTNLPPQNDPIPPVSEILPESLPPPQNSLILPTKRTRAPPHKLKDFHCPTLRSSTSILSTESGELLQDPEVYRRLVGRLLYLNLTRPDLSYAAQHLSQFVSAPRVPHLDAALHVMR
ncbi:hypothetical protein V2J09_020663 [Rumex salicifolius]